MNHTSSKNPQIQKLLEKCHELLTSWNNSICNKLLDIKPTIGEYQSVVRNIRREEVVLARLRLGHTRVTHFVQLENMYRYLNSSLKLSDIVRGLSCQQSYCN